MTVQEDTLGFIVADQLEVPKSPEGLVTLPGGALIEGKVHAEVRLNEISGHEEDLLANPKILPEKKLEELIKRTIARIGPYEDRKVINEAVPTLLTGDRAYLIIALRRLSLGDSYSFIERCPTCKHEAIQTVDLAALAVKAAQGPRVRTERSPSGKEILWHFMTGHDETRNNAQAQKESDLLSIGILARVDAINGNPATMAAVKSLSTRDREWLRTRFEECEPGVDMNIELQCPNPNCNKEYSHDMDIELGFFFPSQVQKLWKTRS